ncbi:MAG: hypothetical protein J0L97_08800 [Alphaproteobacteria bacterium]|nr:hypothetical protein [Alphaproteobacteria bacterium]
MDDMQKTYANRIRNGSLYAVAIEDVPQLFCYQEEPERLAPEMEVMLAFCRATGISTLLFTAGGHWFLPEDAARQFPRYFEYTRGMPPLHDSDSVIIAIGEARSSIIEQHGWMALQKDAESFALHYAYADDPPSDKELYAFPVDEEHRAGIYKPLYGIGINFPEQWRDFAEGKFKEDPLKGDFMYPYWAYEAKALPCHANTVYHLRRGVFLPLNAREAELLQVHQLNAYDGIDMPGYYRLGGGEAPGAFPGMSNCIQYAIDMLHRVVDTRQHNLYEDLGIGDDQLRRVKVVESAMARMQVKQPSESIVIENKGYASLGECTLLGRHATLFHTAAMHDARITEFDMLPHLRQRAMHISLPETSQPPPVSYLHGNQHWVERIAISDTGLTPILVANRIKI